MKREDFPLLKEIVYLDSAAGTLKPIQVVDEIRDFYLKYPINPHSIDSKLGVSVRKKVDEARNVVANLIDASANEVIFTSGSTDSLNRTATMFKAFLKPGDEILISKYNHVSNIIPWIQVAKETGAKAVISTDIISEINDATKIVCYAQTNNSLYQFIDRERLYKETKKHNAVLINDAAQAIMHQEVSLHEADVIVFSGNKLYGPTGIGVLAIRKELLSLLKPATYGGGAVGTMVEENWEPKEGIDAFEAGTPNTAGILGLGRAVKYFNEIDLTIEQELAIYVFDELSKLDGIKIISRRGDANTLFNYKEFNAQDVVSYLGHKGIILRSGVHCAKLIPEITNTKSSIRVSLASYNTKEDIDKMILEIKKGGDFIDYV